MVEKGEGLLVEELEIKFADVMGSIGYDIFFIMGTESKEYRQLWM